MIKTMFRMFMKSFLGLIGLTIGLLCALMVLFSFIASVNSVGGQNVVGGLKSLPDSKGVINPLGKSAPLIAVVELNGVISGANQNFKQMQEFFLDMDKGILKDRLKGIILHISSPGGEVFEVNNIYSFIKEWKERHNIPVYAYVNSLCASGGYYIACACDKIYSGEIGLVGSIGIVSSPFFNVKAALSKIGVNALVMSSGKDKATLNPFTDWTPGEQEKRQEILDFFYEKFVKVVTQNRKELSEERLINFLGANLFSPDEALKEGLVDYINISRNEIIQELSDVLGIKDNYRVIGLAKNNWWKKVVGTISSSPLISGRLQHEIVFQECSDSMVPCSYSYGLNGG